MKTHTSPSRISPATASRAQRLESGVVHLSHLVLASAASILVLAWVVVLLVLQVKRSDALEAETRQNQNLARVLQEQTLRVLATVDQATLRMRDSIAAGEFRQGMYERFANETGMTPNILTQLSFIGADGRFLGSNLDVTGKRTNNVDLAAREHVRVHLKPESVENATQQLSQSGLFIGKPVLGKVSGRWTIQLTRKIQGRDGRVIGVVVASLNPEYLEGVYGSVLLGEKGIVALVGDDLTVRTRTVGGKPDGMGRVLAGRPGQEQSLIREGLDIRTSRVDGVERIVASHRVGDYPLTLSVGSTTAMALSDWNGARRVALTLTGLFSLSVVIGACIFIFLVRRLESRNRELAISETRAQSANQAKSEFLAAISHELRTPLTSIRGFAELMEHRLDNPRFRESAGLIRKAAEHLNALLTEILDLSKVEAGSMSLKPEPTHLPGLLKNSAEFYAVSAAEKGLQLDVEINPSAPETLMCDGLRLRQILNNLLSNAMKFTQHGSVRLMLDSSPQCVLIHVVDTGPGIAPELQELIFERFRQGDARVSYEHGGTGLGLALSRALAELMGGSLAVESRPGQGARFTLSLPRSAPSVEKPAS